MSQIYVFTAGDVGAREHLEISIRNPIPVAKAKANFPAADHQRLEEIAQENGGLYAWGATPGRMNDPVYRLLEVGDWMFCVYGARYRYVARVVAKFDNAQFARDIWGETDEGKTWEKLFFLSKPVELNAPIEDHSDYLARGYQGFSKAGPGKLQQIALDFGSVDAFVKQRFLKEKIDQPLNDQYFLIRSNLESQWEDQLGNVYRFGSTVPNHKKLMLGGWVLVDRKLPGGAKIVGYGKLAPAVALEATNQGAPDAQHFIAKFLEWYPLVNPMVLPGDLQQQLESLDGYNIQHAIRRITEPFYKAALKGLEIEKQIFQFNGSEFWFSPSDVLDAFSKTSPEDWQGQPGVEPYRRVFVGANGKPLKAVFRNMNGVTPGFEFTTNQAARIFTALGFEVGEPHVTEGTSPQQDVVTNSEELVPYTMEDALQDLFMDEDQVQEMVHLANIKKNVVLQGSPGVGKTFVAERLAYLLAGFKSNRFVETVQFHQSYAYEDFIQGYRPKEGGGFEKKDGVFLRFCQKASRDLSHNYVLIIDEINRGNLSKIFGELLRQIEGDKRSEKWAVSLAYSDEGSPRFFIPDNLYIIGLMNTADRSLAMVDYALRRRFAFVKIKPAFASPSFKHFMLERGVPEGLLGKIVSTMISLNERIAADPDLRDGYCVGHSYFCPNGNEHSLGEQWHQRIVRTEIQPLLEEYWFDKGGNELEEIVNGLI